MFGLRLGGMGLIPRRSGASGPANSATDWYFSQFGLAGTPWADVSRTGLGTRVDSAGLVGFGSHNILPDSKNISTGFTGQFLTKEASAVAAPAGQWSDTVWKLVEAAANARHYWFRASPTFVAGATNWFYVAARAAERTHLFIEVWDNSVSSLAVFNLAAGTCTGTGASMLSLGGGWWLCVVQRSCAGANGDWGFGPHSGTSSSYPGDGISGVLVCAPAHTASAQSVYIPTTTAARYLPRITHDPALDINGVPYTVTEQYGAELVTNGDFGSATGWTLGVGVSIGSGQLSFATASNTFARQDLAVTAGRTYLLTFTQTAYTSGAPFLSIGLGSVVTIPSPSTLGTKTMLVTAGASDLGLRIYGGQVGVGGTWSMDNISVREYLGTVTNGTPRPLGLLVEGQGTNIEPVTMLTDVVTLTPAAAIGADGLPSMTLVTVNAASSFKKTMTNVSLVSGTTYTRRLSLRAGSSTLAQLFAANCTVTSARVISGPGSFGTPSGTSVRITGLTSALTQVAYTFTANATGAQELNVYPGDWNSQSAGNSVFVGDRQTETGSVATSYIPNPGTGTAVRVADWTGPGVALTGAALAAAFPAGFGQNTMVFSFAKTGTRFETLLALSAGTGYSPGNGLLIRDSGASSVSVGGNSGSVSQGGLTLDGVAFNRVAVSWSGTNVQLSVNGQAPVSLGTLDFTGSGTTSLILGALTTGGLQPIASAIFRHIRVLPGQYITGAALQALTA